MADTVRIPHGGAAQLRADLRRLGVRRGARRWALHERDALLIAAGLPAGRAAVAAVLRRVLRQVER